MSPFDSEQSPCVGWYREPMVWLVVGLPLASILAGVAMIVIASQAGAVRDEVPEALKVPRGPVLEAPLDAEHGR